MIMDGYVNLTIGYFASNAARDRLMTSSFPYHTSSLIWAIPPGRLNTSLEKLLKPFGLRLWICFFTVLALSFAVIFFLKQQSQQIQDFVFGRGNSSAYLNVVNVMLGGSLSILPTRNFARTVLGLFMLYCFIVQNSYKGGLFKFMQKTLREPEIQSTEELISKNFKLYMLPSSRGFFTQMPKILDNAVIITADELAENFDKLSEPDFKGALLTSNDHLAYRNYQASPHFYYHHADEIIMTHNLVVYMTKQSCLAFEINQIVVYLVSGGFIQAWASRFTDKNFLKHTSSSKTVALTMSQLSGAFQLLFVGLFICLVFFIAEMFFRKFPA
jgi:Ligand-gated ion channel